MATVDKTWAFLADTEGLADVGDSAITFQADTAGNPAQSVHFVGAATGIQERGRRATTGQTWETWGVPAGATVTDVQVISWNSRKWAVMASQTPTISIRVVDSGGASVHSAGDLVSLGLGTGADVAWISQGAGTSRAVDAGKQASDTDVRLEIELDVTAANTAWDIAVDTILLRITYTVSGVPGTQGPNFPGTTASLANAGTSENAEAWVNPGNVVSDNGVEATITAATFDTPDISQLLVCSNFGFTIPTNATIMGITVEIERRDQAIGAASDNRVQLAKGTAFANLVGTNKADTALDWPTAATIKSYGGAADLWGASWTPAEINASSFAVMLSVQADAANTDIFVDFVRITIDYVAPVTGPSAFGRRRRELHRFCTIR